MLNVGTDYNDSNCPTKYTASHFCTESAMSPWIGNGCANSKSKALKIAKTLIKTCNKMTTAEILEIDLRM